MRALKKESCTVGEAAAPPTVADGLLRGIVAEGGVEAAPVFTVCARETEALDEVESGDWIFCDGGGGGLWILLVDLAVSGAELGLVCPVVTEVVGAGSRDMRFCSIVCTVILWVTESVSSAAVD